MNNNGQDLNSNGQYYDNNYAMPAMAETQYNVENEEQQPASMNSRAMNLVQNLQIQSQQLSDHNSK